MIQGRIHQNAGLQELLLNLGKTHASFLAEGSAAGGFRFANQPLRMQLLTQRLQLLGGRCGWNGDRSVVS